MLSALWLEAEEYPEGGENRRGDGALRKQKGSRCQLPQQQGPLEAREPRSGRNRQGFEHDGPERGQDVCQADHQRENELKSLMPNRIITTNRITRPAIYMQHIVTIAPRRVGYVTNK